MNLFFSPVTYEGRSKSFAIQYDVQMVQKKNSYIIFQCNLPLHQYTSDICQKVLLFHAVEIRLRGLELVVIKKSRYVKVLLEMSK